MLNKIITSDIITKALQNGKATIKKQLANGEWETVLANGTLPPKYLSKLKGKGRIFNLPYWLECELQNSVGRLIYDSTIFHFYCDGKLSLVDEGQLCKLFN